jgi:hypothetical protein
MSLSGEGRNWRACDSPYRANSCQVNSVSSPSFRDYIIVLEPWQTKILPLRQSVNTPFENCSPDLPRLLTLSRNAPHNVNVTFFARVHPGWATFASHCATSLRGQDSAARARRDSLPRGFRPVLV